MQDAVVGSFQGFLNFVREQGVMGLAIGFILGTAVTKVVTSFVQDVLNPIIGILVGSTDSLANWAMGTVKFGAFLTATIDFLIIAAIVYALFKALKLEKLDIKKL